MSASSQDCSLELVCTTAVSKSLPESKDSSDVTVVPYDGMLQKVGERLKPLMVCEVWAGTATSFVPVLCCFGTLLPILRKRSKSRIPKQYWTFNRSESVRGFKVKGLELLVTKSSPLSQK